MIRLVSWNINRSTQALQDLVSMEADVALLQEVHVGGWEWLAGLGGDVAVTPHSPWEPWPERTYDRWPLVVQLSNRVRLEWFRYGVPNHWVNADAVEVSGIGTIAMARVVPLVGQEDPFIAASMYARWRPPHPSIGDRDWITADAAAHRIISDLSIFTSPRDGRTHRILAAGDMNMGFANRISPSGRSMSVRNRFEVLGFEYLGPNGEGGDIVPTFRTRTQTPAEANTQLDHVFASNGLAAQLNVRALNSVDEWGPSDHCRIQMEIADA